MIVYGGKLQMDKLEYKRIIDWTNPHTPTRYLEDEANILAGDGWKIIAVVIEGGQRTATLERVKPETPKAVEPVTKTKKVKGE